MQERGNARGERKRFATIATDSKRGTQAMLENLSRDPLNQPQLIPDPWEAPNPTTVQPKLTVKTWQIPIETHLITAAGNPAAPRLAAALTPIQVLLQDELKLRVDLSSKLKTQMEKALALLCWMRTAV
ncbi:MAG: hypothetical protein N4J56_004118 [Chroococcidiopsis sp. SAG 2025]|nr:hypothetical protein [Chroococcidiopsis sp. SAG 2025]